MQLEPGMTLASGRYRLQHRLGEGGFGEVWCARDAVRNDDVALKLLHPELAGRPAILERFEREIHIGVWLAHRAIPRVLDAGRDGGRHYFAMQFVAGSPLGTTPLATAELLGLFAELLDVLAYAHARGVIHRDLKPANVLVVREADGRASVRLLDFGIVRVAGSARAALKAGADDDDKTLGSVFWMSPEQACGEAASVGPASDLYALGVMLFEQLAGHVPFSGSLANVVFAHIASPPPPLVPRPQLALSPAVLDGLGGLVAALLAKSYGARPEFAVDVRTWLDGVRAPLAPPRPAAPTELTGDVAVLDAATGAPDDERTMLEPLPRALAVAEAHAEVTPPPRALQALDLATAALEHAHTIAPASDAADAARGAAWGPLGPGRRNLLRLADPPLAGRAELRASLDALVAELVAGTRQRALILVTGAPGIGKSRLARWLAERVHEHGQMRVLRLDLEARRSLVAALQFGLIELLRNPRLEREPLTQRIEQVLALEPGARTELVDLLLAGAELHASGRSPIPPPVSVAAIAAAAQHPRPRPLLVWLDGLGRESAAMVAYWCTRLLEHARRFDVRLAVVWSCEPGVAADELDAVVAAHAPMHLELDALDESAQLELLRGLVAELDDDSAQLLAARCGGHPLFLREMLLDLVEAGALRDGHLADSARARPPRLEDTLRARVERLVEDHGAACADALAVLGLMGRTWSARQLRQIFDALGVVPVDLVSAGLAVWQRNGERHQLGFANPPLRGLLLEQALDHPQRERLVALALDARLHASLDAMGRSRWEDARHELELAWGMLDEAQTPRCTAARLRTLDLRARIAARQADAAGVLEHASAMSELAGSSDDVALQQAGWAAIAAQWLAHAEVLRDAHAAADAQLVAAERGVAGLPRHSEARARVDHRRSLVARMRGDLGTARARLVAVREALAHAVPGQSGLDARLRALDAAHAASDLAEVLSSLGELEAATGAFDAALAGFRAHGDPQYEARAHLLLARHGRKVLAHTPVARRRQVIELVEGHLEAAAALLDSLDDLLGQAVLVWEAARLELERERRERAAELLAEAHKLFGAAGNRSGMAACANALGEVCRARGELDRAAEHYRSVVALARDSGNALHLGAALFNVAAVQRARGRTDEAAELVAQSLAALGAGAPLALRVPPLLVAAELAALRGERAEARAQLAALLEALGAQPLHDDDAAAALARLEGHAAAAGDAELARLALAVRAALGDAVGGA